MSSEDRGQKTENRFSNMSDTTTPTPNVEFRLSLVRERTEVRVK